MKRFMQSWREGQKILSEVARCQKRSWTHFYANWRVCSNYTDTAVSVHWTDVSLWHAMFNLRSKPTVGTSEAHAGRRKKASLWLHPLAVKVKQLWGFLSVIRKETNTVLSFSINYWWEKICHFVVWIFFRKYEKHLAGWKCNMTREALHVSYKRSNPRCTINCPFEILPVKSKYVSCWMSPLGIAWLPTSNYNWAFKGIILLKSL